MTSLVSSVRSYRSLLGTSSFFLFFFMYECTDKARLFCMVGWMIVLLDCSWAFTCSEVCFRPAGGEPVNWRGLPTMEMQFLRATVKLPPENVLIGSAWRSSLIPLACEMFEFLGTRHWDRSGLCMICRRWPLVCRHVLVEHCRLQLPSLSMVKIMFFTVMVKNNVEQWCVYPFFFLEKEHKLLQIIECGNMRAQWKCLSEEYKHHETTRTTTIAKGTVFDMAI